MLNGKGVPVTCAKSRAQRFESSKARNLVDNLPKTLKRFHFRVEAFPEIVEHKEEVKEKTEEKDIIKSYKIMKIYDGSDDYGRHELSVRI